MFAKLKAPIGVAMLLAFIVVAPGPSVARDAISAAALAACRAEARKHPARFDPVVRVADCQRSTARRARARLDAARGAEARRRTEPVVRASR